ncbi:MAG: S1C family serine protease [Verrucomicrobiae bacterium]|nr:S1C family serine protease [Verrucomicrobiae bacterium]NNJ42568.1 serine protease [Akkermansiaceae bacterium]
MTRLLPIPAAGLFLFVTASLTQAAPLVQKIDDLKSLQTKITRTVKHVTPATISLFSTKNGASGSGVIVSKDGLILTAGHVVRGAEEMTVIFTNGQQARAKVLGAHYTQDTAMAQIIDPAPSGAWPYAEVGQSKSLTSSDLVIALGHAGGFDPIRTPPVRFGRIIARGPNQFISTDCTLIGGDSGGPLFDLDGRVIGIHSSIGASLSSNNHASIEGFHKNWGKLKNGETWGRLGSSMLDDPDAPVLGIITRDSARLGLSVRHVFDGGPASDAGLRAGDIIRTINRRATPNLRVLHATLSRYNAGDSIKVGITRGKLSRTLSVTLGRRGDILPHQ